MTRLLVHTARIDSRDPDRLDVTRRAVDVARKKGAPDPPGAFLAPSWGILQPVIEARTRAHDLTQMAKKAAGMPETIQRPDEWALVRDAESLFDESWKTYVDGYLAEMRVSYSACGACDGTDPEDPAPDYQHTCAWNRGPRPPPHRPGHFRFNIATAEAWKRGARSHRIDWLRLLSRPRVVLVCYCTEAERCHRFLLRTRILPALGAVDAGEILKEAA